MELDHRYIVLKVKDIQAADCTTAELHALGAVCDRVHAHRARRGKGGGELDCMVIERDWPEFAPALRLLSARVDGMYEGAGSLDQVLAELDRAVAKFPTWPTDPLHAAAVLGEEFGELTKAVLQFTYEPHKTSADEIREEAIQTAAMALRFVFSLEHYGYEPAKQHSQNSLNEDTQHGRP